MNDTTLTLTLNDRDEAVKLFGNRDQFLRLIRDALGVRIIARGDTIQKCGRRVAERRSPNPKLSAALPSIARDRSADRSCTPGTPRRRSCNDGTSSECRRS